MKTVVGIRLLCAFLTCGLATSLSCSSGYFWDETNGCLKCPDNCQFCDSRDYCLSCENGYWGTICENPCTLCKAETSCRRTSGFCLTACKDGFTGVLCDSRCSENCLSCNRTNAQVCLNCAQGWYQLVSCNKPCPEACYNRSCNATGSCEYGCENGFWGQSCERSCSGHCLEAACYQENGSCLNCAQGWYQPVSCNKPCPEACYNRSCNATGSCEYGCENGFWGQSCERSCAGHCLEAACYQANGSCLSGCEEGYTGTRCERETSKETSTTIVVLVGTGVAVIFLTAVVVTVVCIRRKRARENPEEEKYVQTEGVRLLEAAPSTSRGVEIVENKPVVMKEPRTEEEELLEAAPSTSRGVEIVENKPVVMKKPRTEEEELLEAAPSTSRGVEIVENKHVVKKEPRTEEEKLLEDLKEDLIAYYRDKESTMSVAPLVEQHDAKITKFYVRPPMIAYNKPNAFGQQKQSDKKSGGKKSEEKTNIQSYRELLLNGNDPYKGIYVTADAGMGKTSFAKMLAVTWCEAHASTGSLIRKRLEKHDIGCSYDIGWSYDIETLKKFDFLFLIKLRDFETTPICSLDEMILEMMQTKLQHKSQYTEELLETVLCNKRCLIIVDGLDEWIHPQSCRRGEVIPHRRTWPKCTVLTTTRPWKLSTARISMADIDRQVEISQLDETTALELESRAVEILNENQRQNGQVAANSERKTVTDFENSVPNKILGHIRYIPFMLQQMICLWFGNIPVGKSLCEVYSNIIELTLTRWLVKTESGHTDCECKPSQEHENIKLKCMENNRHCQRYMPLLLKIGELAFSTLFNVIREESLLFDKKQVLKYLSKEELKQCLDMGLLSQVKDPTSLSEVRLQLYFPHKTLHEFFCALFIATNWNNANTGTMSIKQTISNKCMSVSDILEMSEVFVFVCGLNPEVYSDISRPFATIVSTDQSVIDYRNNVEDYMYSDLLWDYQRKQISCFLESTRNQHPECKIVIEDIFVGGRHYDRMEEDEKQALERILPYNVCSMKSLTLYKLSAGGIVRILEHVEFPCLERLSVQEYELTLFQSVLTSAAHTLKCLRLGEVSLPDDMCSAISPLNNLHALYLGDVDVSSDRLNAVSDCISGFMSLQKLKLNCRYKPSDTDEKPEQRKASINYLLRSIEAKTMLTCLSLDDDVSHQNYVLDLSKHDKLQELHLSLPLTELHVNTEQLVMCKVCKMYGFSAAAVSSLLAELHGAPVLETLTLIDIRNSPPRIDITALPILTKFSLWVCDLRDSTVTLTLPLLTQISLDHCDLTDSTVTLTLPLLTKFTLWHCDLRDSTVTLSPEMTRLKTITLQWRTTVNIPGYRELFLSISKLPQPITVWLEFIDMTAGEWRELLFDILGKLPKSIHVEMQECRGPPDEEWRNIFDDMKASPAFCVTHTDYNVGGWETGAHITFDKVVV